MTQEISLPNEWVLTTIGEIVTFEYGKGLRKDKRNSKGTIDVYGSNGRVGYHDRYLVKEPCLIIGRKGAAGEVHISYKPCWPIDTTYYVIPPKNINLKFLYYLLSNQNLASLDRSTAIPGLNRNDAYSIKISLPPFPEQGRIVERIESLFTQLDAGVADLKRTQVTLKRYKASVLKLACEGKLVPQNPSDELAEGILRLKGRSPLVDDYLPSLPNGWCWVTVEQIVSSEPGSIQSGPFGSDLHHSEFQDTGVLAIGIDNVRDGSFSLGKQHMISIEKYNQLQKFTARPFDVLITVMATVGRCCVTPSNIGTAIITKHVYRLSVEKTLVSPYYLMYNLLGGEEVRKQIFSQVRGQTRPGINGTILRSISIPLAPLEEQQRIVVELESRLSVIQEVEQTIETNLKRARRLRQSIIKCAFEGRLV